MRGDLRYAYRTVGFGSEGSPYRWPLCFLPGSGEFFFGENFSGSERITHPWGESAVRT